MSSFSSVVQKSGKKIVPKAAPRRNVQRKATSVASTVTSISQTEGPTSETPASPVTEPVPATGDLVQDEQTSQEVHILQEPADTVQTSSQMNESTTTGKVQTQSPQLTAPHQPDVAVPSQSIIKDASAEQITRVVASPDEFERIESLPVDTTGEDAYVPDNTQAQLRVNSPSDLRVSLPPEGDHHITGARSVAGSFKRQRKAANHTTVSTSLRKRRKTAPRAAPEIALSQVPPVTTGSQSSVTVPIPPPPRSRSRQSQPTDDLLRSATQRAATVSELANSIETQTRLLRPRTRRSSTSETGSQCGADGSEDSVTPIPHPERIRLKRTAQEQAAEVIANAFGKHVGSAHQKDTTPENAEEYELEPAKITMADLCADSRLGKKSTLESEMQANWSEILQRRKEDRERALANAEKRRRKGTGHRILIDSAQEPVTALAPSMAVVNGVIVVDQASREIDRSAQLQQAAAQDLDNVREDRDYYKYVNQNTVGMKPGHGRHSKWDEESTERFLKGLRIFGTDFLMIANMFPGLTRKQIKMKFIREENANKSRVLDCLRNREPVQLEDYAQMADKESEEFHTLESIQKELDEQERKLREEDNQRRKREGFVNADDAAHVDHSVPAGVEDVNGRYHGSAESGRFEAVAREIVDAAARPKKRQRKTNTVSSRRGPKGSRRPEGGIEEILGSITEVAV